MRKHLKILFATRSADQFLYFKSIAAALCCKCNDVKFIYDRKWTHPDSIGKLENFRKTFPTFDFGYAVARRDFWRNALFHLRELRTYRSYILEPRKNLRKAYQDRWREYLPNSLRILFNYGLPKAILASAIPGFILEALEKIIPADKRIINDIKSFAPDAVLASPVNMRFSSADLEYLKAAKFLGIPTVTPVYSWDNLTTKGLYHVLPDLLLAWNTAHAKEAQEHQGMPADKIKIIGAPLFDEWFDLKPISTRIAFCKKFGLKEKYPILLYLGSSVSIAADESWLIGAFRKALDGSQNPALRKAQIIIRPHPSNWHIYDSFKLKDVIVIPEKGVLPDTEESFRLFNDCLAHSAVVLNINTSAMIEAMIVDRPVIAVVDEKYKDAQFDMEYFRQIMKSGAAAMAYSPEEAAEIVGGLLFGSDQRRENRKTFIRDYIRPHGLGVSAGETAAAEIEKYLC